MKKIIIKSKKSKNTIKIENIEYADSFKKRLFGLMNKEIFDGMLFKLTNSHKIFSSIHTSFMKVPIDIIYINNNMQIEEILTLNPWNIYIPQRNNSKYILELPENTINTLKINKKDMVIIK